MHTTTIDALGAAFLESHRVARLATTSSLGIPSIVPVCYAWDGHEIWIALDEKPKQSTDVMQLRRVRNILEQPNVAFICDDYLASAWDQLAYLLVHGTARIAQPTELAHQSAMALLRTRYPQYQAMAITDRPAIAIAPQQIIQWGAVKERGTRPALIEDVIPGRRSVRRFTSTPVRREQLERLVDAARWAPSPHGRQPWRFAILQRSETKEQLAAAMGIEWESTLAQDGEAVEVVAQRLALSRERIRTAPAIILPCLYLEDLDVYPDAHRQEDEKIMAIQSLGAAIQNMLLVAYHEGLDMGWMCAPLFCQDVVRNAIQLPKTWQPQALLPVGYAAADPKRRPHRPVADLVYWDE